MLTILFYCFSHVQNFDFSFVRLYVVKQISPPDLKYLTFIDAPVG